MKTIIAGGREYHFILRDFQKLAKIHEEYPITEVVSGCAKGADTCGEFWACYF